MPATLHRCRTPTNWLCPCGRVARRLGGRGIEFEQVRVAWRRVDREDLADLSGQRVVPVLEIDDQFICDSHRIVEYLDFRSPRP